MRKKKILYVGEFSGLNTGYATISRNLIAEFIRTGKYEVAELSSYKKDTDPYHQQLASQLPWKTYGNLPVNDGEDQIYRAHPQNEFGRWKFDAVCLDFQPDIVASFRDYWMDSFIDQSLYRKIFKTVMMPTVDARSQNLEWLDLYCRTDHVLTYTNFAYNVLKEEGGGLIPLRGIATPAVDVNTYKFCGDRRKHKEQFGLPPDSIIVGMVARNQKRKLYPDLTEAFAEFVRRMNFTNTNNLYLYLHCSIPDVGWDLPKYFKDAGIAHKVIMTYFCHNCKRWFPSFYQDAATLCKFCRHKSAVLSNSHIGVDTASLAAVYNFMDLYVQFVTCEGLGIPALEAGACGCPVVGTYYSGVEDVLDNLQGKKITAKPWHEAETSRVLSYPSVDELIDYIEEFTSLPESVRYRMSVKTAELTRKHYGSWANVAQTWMDIFDSISLPEQNLWAVSPIEIIPTNIAMPQQQMSDEQFIAWCVGEIIRRPDWINGYAGLKMLRDLAWGRTTINNLGFFLGELSQVGAKPEHHNCNRETLLNMVLNQRNMYNQSEQMRALLLQQGKLMP